MVALTDPGAAGCARSAPGCCSPASIAAKATRPARTPCSPRSAAAAPLRDGACFTRRPTSWPSRRVRPAGATRTSRWTPTVLGSALNRIARQFRGQVDRRRLLGDARRPRLRARDRAPAAPTRAGPSRCSRRSAAASIRRGRSRPTGSSATPTPPATCSATGTRHAVAARPARASNISISPPATNRPGHRPPEGDGGRPADVSPITPGRRM